MQLPRQDRGDHLQVRIGPLLPYPRDHLRAVLAEVVVQCLDELLVQLIAVADWAAFWVAGLTGLPWGPEICG
jgi:hypothetical protein